VKDYVNELGIDGVHVDVDTEEGLSAARHYGVMASPTVIFFDEEKKELFRAHNLSDLKKRMEIGVGA
jgi:thioredoxin-related protein